MNKFIFIIPRTLEKFQDAIRPQLWKLCMHSLQKQSFQNWIALLIGGHSIFDKNDNRFIKINFEGTKEEKLQIATDYIIRNNIEGEYIIRLDDDDIINPYLLAKVIKYNFDIYVDKHQWFWHYESGFISNRVWNWFPNTYIHKREHALSEWGDYAKGYFNKFKP